MSQVLLYFTALFCHSFAPDYLQNSLKLQKYNHLLQVSSFTTEKALPLQGSNKEQIEYTPQAYLLQISSSSLCCWNCCLWLSRKYQLHGEAKVHEEVVGLPGKKAERTQTSQLPISCEDQKEQACLQKHFLDIPSSKCLHCIVGGNALFMESLWIILGFYLNNAEVLVGEQLLANLQTQQLFFTIKVQIFLTFKHFKFDQSLPNSRHNWHGTESTLRIGTFSMTSFST